MPAHPSALPRPLQKQLLGLWVTLAPLQKLFPFLVFFCFFKASRVSHVFVSGKELSFVFM